MKNLLISSFFLFFSVLLSAQTNSPQVSTDGSLTVTANVTYTNPYYYAVWIKGTTGTFLRTITMFGNNANYYNDLAHWNSESGRNKVNATTGATKSSAMVNNVSTWNGKDQVNSAIVADGTYTVSIEMSSESYGTNSKYITTTFTKGPTAVTLNPTNVSPITGVSIKWQPVNTGIDNIELSTLYSIYPNPAITSVYVNGPDIQSVDVFTLEGKRIFSSNQQKLNIAALKKGTYMLSINTGKGNVSKKLIKN
jgi:hypothetical protein